MNDGLDWGRGGGSGDDLMRENVGGGGEQLVRGERK
jgi:hypothetical protein